MRRLLLAAVALVSLAPRAEAGPSMFSAWDMRPSRAATLRLGVATLQHVTVPDRGSVLFLGAIRTTWAPRRWIEVGLGGHLSEFSGHLGIGVPNVHVGWIHQLDRRVRIGLLGRTSIGELRSAATTPADLAAGAFLLDEAVTWTQAWTWTMHADAQWSNDCMTVQGGAGVSFYAGGALAQVQSVLRLQAGVARHFGESWSASAEALVITDALDEGPAEPYDFVPVGTVALRHQGRVRLGGGLSYGWVNASADVGRPGLVLVLDATGSL